LTVGRNIKNNKNQNMNKIKFMAMLSVISAFSIVTSCEKDDLSNFNYETSYVNVGTKNLETYVGGSGSNTIVFETGLGVDGKTWFTNKIFETIGASNQVIAYNRAGYPPSTQNGETRGLQILVNDLDSIINAKSINSKVILVGHSLGGAIVRTYAIQHPDKVKALLLIDPNHESFSLYANMTQEQEDTLVQQETTANNIGGAIEARQLIENISFLQSLPNLPDIPVTVLTSTKVEGGLTQADVDNWILAHQSLNTGVTKFTHIMTNKSGHFIYIDEPQLVIDNIISLTK
jgi:pimeloyl-ACP methyl ester carboxylesterase